MDFSLWAGIGQDCCILKDAYAKDNYRYFDTTNKTGRCLICFSGNGLFFPNTQEAFERVIVHNDRYEWGNMVKSEAILNYYQRIILIRDIYKEWYVTGVNNRLNSVDLVVEKLRELAIVNGNALSISTVGNSAGGYAAVLFGLLLGAERVFNFSGQYNINHEIYIGGEMVSPFLEMYREKAGKYYDLKPMLMDYTDNINIYYFFPYKCKWDRDYYETIKDIDIIKSFKFCNKNHGETVWGGVEIDILTSDDKKLLDVYNSEQLFSRFSFALHYHSLWWCCTRFLKFLKKRVFDLLNSVKRKIYF